MFIITIFQETFTMGATINKAEIKDLDHMFFLMRSLKTLEDLWRVMIRALVVIGCPYEVTMATMLECVLCVQKDELSSVCSIFLKLILSLALRIFYRCVGGLFALGPRFPLNYQMSLHRLWQQTPENSARTRQKVCQDVFKDEPQS